MSTPRFTYGLLPSPPSNNDSTADVLLGAAGAPPPEESLELLAYVSTHNQGGTSTCVWQAIAQAVWVYLSARGKQASWLSVMFGYWNTLKLQGHGMSDDGCVPRVALQVLTDAGFCSESEWPFDESKVLAQPPPDAYTAAYDQRVITKFHRLFSQGEQLKLDIKTAINQKRPVIYGSPVDQAYESYTHGIIQVPKSPFLGSHMRCLVGYTKDFAIESNSWGDWGMSGLGHLSWDVITWPMCHDFWIFDDAPVLSEYANAA